MMNLKTRIDKLEQTIAPHSFKGVIRIVQQGDSLTPYQEQQKADAEAARMMVILRVMMDPIRSH